MYALKLAGSVGNLKPHGAVDWDRRVSHYASMCQCKTTDYTQDSTLARIRKLPQRIQMLR